MIVENYQKTLIKKADFKRIFAQKQIISKKEYERYLNNKIYKQKY